jgi:hypothetical protein
MATFSWARQSGPGRRERTVGDFGRTKCNRLDGGGDILGLEANTNPFALVLLFTIILIVMLYFLLIQRISLLSSHRTLRASAYARRPVAANARQRADRFMKDLIIRLDF